MKLVIVTAVEEFQNEVLKLFKNADIESFSTSDIDGYKSSPNLLATSSWFPSIKGASESHMFFSFTEQEQIERLFHLIAEFNSNIETNNPIRGIVLPIEKYI
ncbi:hypothetical protein [Winogradskyella alexanderae]|uniref:Uncharacterized protein n=1 Tax=Winogradskyella alexanderae TaxID=2877123 RepID=A0ABS7XQ98_9FLAO|nr:hypothetical protein [Winogradskyella alexanderae]MCA0131684.1 hypothetical protein [Winogradskyella alexanderae]